MSVHPNIGLDKFPKQGPLLGKRVSVCFNYDSYNRIGGVCVRDDYEEPFRTLFQLDNGRVIDAVECQYTYE